MLILLIFVYALSLIYCANASRLDEIEELIVGGELTKIQEVPYQAAFYFYDYYFCCGCIITRTHIVSAAHCFEILKGNTKGLTVRVGSAKMRSEGQVLAIKKITLHPKYTAGVIDYDAAIAELKVLLTITDVIRPLAIGDKEPHEGEEVRVSGWGYVKETGPASRKLRLVNVKVVDRKACAENYKDLVPITKRMVCAAGDGKDACYGDSGGPLVYKGKLVGIVSSGEGCARKEYPGIYTNVVNPDIRKFIINITKV